MIKTLALLAAFAISYTNLAMAQDQGFYAGLGFGHATAKVDQISLQDVLAIGFDSVSGFQSQADDTSTAWKVYGGYQFMENVAAEFIYADLGKFSRSASGTGIVISPPATLSFNLNSDLEISGFGAAALLSLPVANQWRLFAKPGLFYWDAKNTTTTIAGSSLSASTKKTGTSPSLGMGARYDFTQRFSARIEWERFFDVGDKNTTGKSNVNLLGVSAQLNL